MNRVAQVLADKCTAKLAWLVTRSRPLQIDALTFNGSLKSLLLNDRRIAIEIADPSGFEIYEVQFGETVADGPAVCEARLSDFFLGATRVRKQYASVLELKDSDSSSAWLLVSAYYCAYFACIELCKVINRISLTLEDDELELLKQKAGGPHHADFFKNGATNFVGVENAGKLVFRSVGSKPHAAAWENARLAVSSILGPKGWIDGNRYLALLSNPDCSPSRIRNTWNYKRADYFGSAGEKRAAEFRKLVGNFGGVSGWVDRRADRPDQLDPCVVAVMCETLSAAVIDAAKRGGDIVRQSAA